MRYSSSAVKTVLLCLVASVSECVRMYVYVMAIGAAICLSVTVKEALIIFTYSRHRMQIANSSYALLCVVM